MNNEPTTTRHGNAVLNWVLALTTLLGAAAVVIYAFVQVMATAGCAAHEACPRPGSGEAGFTVIVYGAPLVAAATVALSFFTARKRNGIWVPVGGWLLILLAFVAMLLTSP